MSRIPTETELRDLYIEKKMSLSEIAKFTFFKNHKILYWMDKYRIERRRRCDANYIKHNPHGEPFQIKQKLRRNEVKLKYLALGLYWGEGGKSLTQGVRITNSDPGVIKQFLNYLIVLCKTRNDKIHFYLQTFKDNNVELAKLFWANKLSIDPARIIVGKSLPSMGKGTYKKISINGVMSLGFFNSHLQVYIIKELEKLGLK